ncbi:hypothetical protein EB796_016913 [Bugula neritina]|uniref:RanBP2-type domain-containing protein n=1 Tax=Bugula neritina TaxID=10212 RepID=A0A7J7JGM3_BUGNE|nr:hypothetical protein EB796_016913 [Bugula neritina]
MDNVAAPVVAQLRHSHTLAEIPPQALSNDSGYHTPPNRQHGHTSPPWPTGMHMQWPAHVSPPTCGTPQYFQSRPVAAQRTSAPTPLNQNLTVDTGDPSGHYQPEPSTPQIVIGHPITYSHHSAVPQPHYMTPTSYNRGHDPYHSLPPAQAATPVPAPSPEEANILGYQQDRKNRLFHACAQEETEITKIKEEEEGLLKLLEEERKTNEGVDSEMEKGVTNMTNENKRLASDIQRLTQRLSNPQVRGPIHGYLPLQPPPPPPVSQSAITRPPIPIYNPNDPMINNTPTAPLRPTRVPPPVPPRRSPSRVAEEEEWSCSGCTFLNHPLIASCEICQTPRQTTSRPGSNVL